MQNAVAYLPFPVKSLEAAIWTRPIRYIWLNWSAFQHFLRTFGIIFVIKSWLGFFWGSQFCQISKTWQKNQIFPWAHVRVTSLSVAPIHIHIQQKPSKMLLALICILPHPGHKASNCQNGGVYHYSEHAEWSKSFPYVADCYNFIPFEMEYSWDILMCLIGT